MSFSVASIIAPFLAGSVGGLGNANAALQERSKNRTVPDKGEIPVNLARFLPLLRKKVCVRAQIFEKVSDF